MPQNYFAVLSLEPRFAISPEQLELAYRTVASRVHPDRHAQATAAEQRRAMALAADANEAYRTLKKPAPRARHLLSLRGIELSEKSASIPPEFLLEQIEWREELAAAQAARNDEALAELHGAVRSRSVLLQAQVAKELDVTNDDAAAAQTVQQLMFLEKLIAAIDEALALLET